ncbi:hypothetical protein [Sabulibacter ruber]|nr:hypothetical protein [Sabulibacter ruber]
MQKKEPANPTIPGEMMLKKDACFPEKKAFSGKQPKNELSRTECKL